MSPSQFRNVIAGIAPHKGNPKVPLGGAPHCSRSSSLSTPPGIISAIPKGKRFFPLNPFSALAFGFEPSILYGPTRTSLASLRSVSLPKGNLTVPLWRSPPSADRCYPSLKPEFCNTKFARRAADLQHYGNSGVIHHA